MEVTHGSTSIGEGHGNSGHWKSYGSHEHGPNNDNWWGSILRKNQVDTPLV